MATSLQISLAEAFFIKPMSPIAVLEYLSEKLTLFKCLAKQLLYIHLTKPKPTVIFRDSVQSVFITFLAQNEGKSRQKIEVVIDLARRRWYNGIKLKCPAMMGVEDKIIEASL